MKKFREIYFPDNLISRGELAKESRSNSHNQLKQKRFYSNVFLSCPKGGAAQSAEMAQSLEGLPICNLNKEMSERMFTLKHCKLPKSFRLKSRDSFTGLHFNKHKYIRPANHIKWRV